MSNNDKQHASQEAIQPDEIEMVAEKTSKAQSTNAFPFSKEKIDELRNFCQARPWLRFLSLLLFWLALILAFILLAFITVNFLFCLAAFFKNEPFNIRLKRSWKLFCGSLAGVLSFLVGVVSPFFGLATLILYMFFLEPLSLEKFGMQAKFKRHFP